MNLKTLQSNIYLMKFYLFLFFGLLLSISSIAQTAGNYKIYADKIKQFSKPCRILNNNIDAEGNGSIEFTNAQKQILRFRVHNKKPQTASCQITFEIYYYKNNFLRKIESLDRNGNLIGCDLRLRGEAISEYIIEKPDLYLKKKKLIDDAEGNIELKDDSQEKIIRVQFFDANNQRIAEFVPTYISSKEYWQYNIRMSWP